MAQYGTKEYWENRYQKDGNYFDWYQRWSGIESIVKKHVQPHHRILVIGCGTSRLSEEMYDAGYTDIVSSDYSGAAIQLMNSKLTGKDLKFEVADATHMPQYIDFGFDCVVDKGTLDSILCGEDSMVNVESMLSEIHRVLTPNGCYICISYGQPSYRLSYLKKNGIDWKVEVDKIVKPMAQIDINKSQIEDNDCCHFAYICRKG